MKKTLFSIVLFTLAFAVSPGQNLNTLHVTLDEADTNVLTGSGNIRQTADGGYLIAGTWGTGEYSRATVTKTNYNFQPQWSYVLNYSLNFGISYQTSYGADILELGNDEYVLLAGVNMFALSNMAIAENLDYGVIKFKKTNSSFEVLGAKRFGTDFAEVPHNIERTQDNGFIISGYSNAEQALNVPTIALTYLVKINHDLDIQWGTRYRNNGAQCNTWAMSVLQGMSRRPVIETSDGGYIFTLHCDENLYITKVNAAGVHQWTKTFSTDGAISDSFSDADFGTLGTGAGTGGTVIDIKELPNGDLAFLGNHFTFAFLIYSNGETLEFGGVGAPMSYIFTTSASGVFKKGSAFFRETYNNPNQPTEMLAQEFEVLYNGHFLVSCGAHQFSDGQGNNWYTPSLLEYDLDQSNVVDQSTVQAYSLNIDSEYFYNRDNARGMNGIRLQTIYSTASLSYNMRHAFRLGNIYNMGSYPTCLTPLTGMHSFPIEIALQSTTLTTNDISGGDFPVTPTLDNKNYVREVVCEEMETSTAEINIPQAEAASIASLSPTLNDGNFSLILHDGNWIGSSYAISDFTGKQLMKGSTDDLTNTFDASGLLSGIYIVTLRNNNQQIALKMIVNN